jgi:hypothetical protein
MAAFRMHYTDTPAGRLLSDALFIGQIALNLAADEATPQQRDGLTSRLACNPELAQRMGIASGDFARIAHYVMPHSNFNQLTALTPAQIANNGVAMGVAVALCPRILPVMAVLIEECATELKNSCKASEAFLAQYEAGPLQHHASWRQNFLVHSSPNLSYKPDSYSKNALELAAERGHNLEAEMMPRMGDMVRKLLNPGLR